MPSPPSPKRDPIMLLGGNMQHFWLFRQPLVQALRAQGHPVICVNWGRPHPSFAEFGGVGVTWHHLRGHHHGKLRGSVKALIKLALILRRTRPRSILAFNAKPILFGGWMASWLLPTTRVIALMEGLGAGLNFLLNPKAKQRRRIFRAMTRQITTWVLLNQRDHRLIADLHDLPAERAIWMRGIGINLAAFPAQDPAKLLENRRLVFVGRLVARKGVRQFIEIARLIRQTDPRWQCDIAGLPDAEEPEIVDTVHQAIHDGVIHSCSKINEMAEFLSQGTLLVFPSSYEEGLPAAIMEAQATGLPCLVADREVLHDCIAPGQSGLFLPLSQPSAWAEAIRTVSDPSQFTAMSQAAHAFAAQHYDQDKAIRTLMALIVNNPDSG